MITNKAYKFKLKLNKDQEIKLIDFAGCCRFVWNWFLSKNLEKLKNKQKIMYRYEMEFWLKFYKTTDEFSFLKKCHSQPLQQKIQDLEKAFKDAFDKKQSNKRLPNFKKKGLDDSFRIPQGFKINQDENQIFVPKIG
jgi:putative transposase